MNAIINIANYEMFPDELKNRKELCRELLKFKDKMIHLDIESMSLIAKRFIHQAEQKDSKTAFVIFIITDTEESRVKINKAFKNNYEINSLCEIIVVSKKQIIDFCIKKEFDFIDAMCLSFVLYDREFLSILKLVNMHKLFFNKSIGNKLISYVVVGSFSRLDYNDKSDIDTIAIIDDSNENIENKIIVKESLRNSSYDLAVKVKAKTVIKRDFSPNIYLLSDLWEAIYNGHPIILTFLRDGFPLLDNGVYIPWKNLLKEGKFKFNKEFIEQMFDMSNKIVPMIDDKLTEIVVEDIYWGVVNRIQAIFISKGCDSISVGEIKNKIIQKELSEEINEANYTFIIEIIDIYDDHKHGTVAKISYDKVKLMIERFRIFITSTDSLKSKYKYYY